MMNLSFVRRVVIATAAVLGAAVLPIHSAVAAPRIQPSSPDFPPVALNAPARGEQAIRALGEHLPAVAKAYGLTAQELTERLQGDRLLGVDQHGRLFFADEFQVPQGAGTATGGSVVAASYPLVQTFLLHSKVGASRVIYLDFDGHTLVNNAWNSYTHTTSITCPPWDTDGNAAAFGDSEKTAIQQIWQRVAEDYAPFDVDVTTEYPGEAAITRSSASDLNFGTRVLISAIASYFGNYGGIAYVGVYTDTSDFYKPALVFPEKLGNSEKNIAEAASHEAGHNLGLSHDGATGQSYYAGQGSGETGWAPIMGVGYYQNFTQWSKGEYANANNTEDDLAIITATGLSFRSDDHGDTDATASYFPAGTTLSGEGYIERNTDVDVLAFTTGAGPISLNVIPAPRGPNLDILARLYNSVGVLIASANTATQLAASINTNVAAGTYFLRLEGTGNGSPLTTGYSKYASLGQYVVTGTVVNASGTVPPVANASATPTAGDAPLAVTLDGTQSFDQDGTLSSYAWNFGDGQTGSGATVSHTYNTVGNYTATLTVTDNNNLTGTDTVGISVTAPNVSPVASMSATPSSGYAPLAVSFSSAGSSDPDGNIVSYAWNFGDGSTGSGATVSHTYNTVGNYTATLTVTDNRNATGTATAPISVQANPNAIVRVASIQLVSISAPGGKQGRATVRITNPSNSNVSGAAVTGTWSGLVTGTSSGTTAADGTVILTSPKFKKSGTLTFRVTNVTKSGNTYNAGQNAVTQVSISAAPTR